MKIVIQVNLIQSVKVQLWLNCCWRVGKKLQSLGEWRRMSRDFIQTTKWRWFSSRTRWVASVTKNLWSFPGFRYLRKIVTRRESIRLAAFAVMSSCCTSSYFYIFYDKNNKIFIFLAFNLKNSQNFQEICSRLKIESLTLLTDKSSARFMPRYRN